MINRAWNRRNQMTGPSEYTAGSRLAWTLMGALFGATLFFMWDPIHGRRRRSLLGAKRDHFSHVLFREGGRQTRNLSNRFEGWVVRLSERLEGRPVPADEVLVERVRSAIGRKTRYPRAIVVEAHSGTIVLRGPILSQEVKPLFDCARRVRGVRRVLNRLDVKTRQEDLPWFRKATPERQAPKQAQKQVEKRASRQSQKQAQKLAEKPMERSSEKPTEQPTEKRRKSRREKPVIGVSPEAQPI